MTREKKEVKRPAYRAQAKIMGNKFQRERAMGGRAVGSGGKASENAKTSR